MRILNDRHVCKWRRYVVGCQAEDVCASKHWAVVTGFYLGCVLGPLAALGYPILLAKKAQGESSGSLFRTLDIGNTLCVVIRTLSMP